MSPKHLQPEQSENLGQYTQMWVGCLFDPFFCRKCQVNSRLKWTSLLVSSSNWYLTNSTNLQIVKRQCCQGKSPKSMKLRGSVGVSTSLGQFSQIFHLFLYVFFYGGGLPLGKDKKYHQSWRKHCMRISHWVDGFYICISDHFHN